MLTALWIVAALASEPATVEIAPGRGVTITSADGRHAMRIGGRIQLRETVDWGFDEEGERALTHVGQLRTARLVLAGHVFSDRTRYVFQLAVAEADYRGTGRSPVFDAYLDLAHSPNASVRVGQMFVPFDRARTTREFALQLSDRQSVVAEFNLDRAVGAYVYSDALLDSPFAYRVGVFANNGPNLAALQPVGAVFVARAEVRPLGPVDDDSEGDLKRREAPGLAIGAAAAYSLDTTRVRSTSGDPIPVYAVDYLHLVADLVFKWRGFALSGEFLLRDADQNALSTPAEGVFYTREGWGWFVQPSYQFTRVVGLAARYGDTVPFPRTDPEMLRTHEVAAGPALYFNGHALKVQADWTALWSDDFADARHTVRAQVDVTF